MCNRRLNDQLSLIECSSRSITLSADLESLRRVIYKFGNIGCGYKSAAMESSLVNESGDWEWEPPSVGNRLEGHDVPDSVLQQLIQLQAAVCSDNVKVILLTLSLQTVAVKGFDFPRCLLLRIFLATISQNVI